MRTPIHLAVIVSLLLLPVARASAQSSENQTFPRLDSRITSVGLFKNGVAVVRREVTIPASGTYELLDVPEPVHGTLWLESDALVEARVTTRDVDEPITAVTGSNLIDDLAGLHVTLHLHDAESPTMTGRIMPFEDPAGSRTWDRAYESHRSSHWGWWNQPRVTPTAPPQPRYLLLQRDDGGHVYLDPAQIVWAEISDPAATIARPRRVLQVTASETGYGSSTLVITYLAKGMAWAPSYRVDLTDPATMTLLQKAVMRNELEDLHDVEIELISGFPSVEFAHVLSPFSPGTAWSEFFRQLNQQFTTNHPTMSNVMSQAAVQYRGAESSPGIDALAMPAGEGVDLHYQSIGRYTLKEGDNLMVNVADATAPFERIVEWIVPDTRTPEGRHIEDWQRQQDPDRYADAAWDAVRFENPFTFPMTTAPAMIVTDGRFNGQRTSTWVNPGEETTLRITKALSIRTRSTEREEPGEREFVDIAGRTFRHPTVTGDLHVHNHRAQPVSIVIRRQFSGELVEAGGNPTKELREEGVYSVNPRHELTWTITLAPGEERTLDYRYTVLVRH